MAASSALILFAAAWLLRRRQARRLRRRMRALEAALQASLVRQVHGQRDAAVGRLARCVAHDMQSPLASLEAIAGNLRGGDAVALRLLHQVIGRLRSLAATLLPDAQPQRCCLQPLLPLLQAVVQEKRLLGGAPIVLSYERADLQAAVAAEAFKQVLHNLLDNALQASDAAAAVHLHLCQVAQRCLVRLIDRGRGMSGSQLRRAGELGFSVGKRRGHGLGLHAARATIDALGGELQLLSRPGVGTTVTISLPLGDGDAAAMGALRSATY